MCIVFIYKKKHLFSNNSWFSKPFQKEGFCAWMDEKIRFVLKCKRNKWKTVVIWTMFRLLHSIVCVCTVYIMKVWFQILASSDKKHSFKSFYFFSHPHLLIIIVHPAFTTQKPHGLSKIKFNVWSQLLKILKYLYICVEPTINGSPRWSRREPRTSHTGIFSGKIKTCSACRLIWDKLAHCYSRKLKQNLPKVLFDVI